MKKLMIYLIAIITVFSLGLPSCSKRGDDQTRSNTKVVNKEAKEESHNETAEKIRTHLRTPIDKARAAQQMGEERTKEIDDALKNHIE